MASPSYFRTFCSAILAAAVVVGVLSPTAPAYARPTTSMPAPSAVGAISAGTTSPSITATSVNDDLTPVLPTPRTDPFYTPPVGWEAKAPGTVLRSRQVHVSEYLLPIPEKIYQLLFRTTDSKGRPVTTVTTVFVPLQVAYGLVRNPRVFSFQIAEDSLGLQCSPSVTLPRGTNIEATGVFTALSLGWVGVITDHGGPRAAWTAGRMAGHAVLDGIRAAKNFGPAKVTDRSKIAGYGYSGGGHATAWAAQLQGGYAPDLNSQVVGWVAGDFVADLGGIFFETEPSIIRNGGLLNGFYMAAFTGVSREYPELMQFVSPAGRERMEKIKDLCQIPLAVSALFGTIDSYLNVPLKSLETNPVAKQVFADGSLGDAAPVAPVLLQAGIFDELVPEQQQEYVNERWCAKGAPVRLEYSIVPEHIVNALATIPSALTWIIARFNGLPFRSTC